jgi:DNA-binding MarR family transcriptional regulator
MATAVVRQQRSAADEAWELLRSLLFTERRRFVAAASEHDLHPAQAGALLQMEPGEGVPMHALASMLACDNSNVTGLVDRLEARGLVARRPFAEDRRVKHVVLTKLGLEVRDSLRGLMARPPEAIERLSIEDQRLLRDVLSRAVSGA